MCLSSPQPLVQRVSDRALATRLQVSPWLWFRAWRSRIEDILDATRAILAFTHRLSRQEFFEDLKTLRAVERSFEIIGEAASHVPVDVRLRPTRGD